MITQFLRFPDEATAQTALADYYTTPTDDMGGWDTASLAHALDPIGTLYNDDAVYDTSTSPPTMTTPPTAMPGWHVNFIGTLPDAAAAYLVTPADPRRVFAS